MTSLDPKNGPEPGHFRFRPPSKSLFISTSSQQTHYFSHGSENRDKSEEILLLQRRTPHLPPYKRISKKILDTEFIYATTHSANMGVNEDPGIK
jgi:hypothetical protein